MPRLAFVTAVLLSAVLAVQLSQSIDPQDSFAATEQGFAPISRARSAVLMVSAVA